MKKKHKNKKVSHWSAKKMGVRKEIINLPDAEVVPQCHWNQYIKNRQPYSFGQLIIIPWYKKLWRYLISL